MFQKRIDGEMNKVVDTIEDRIQNVFSTAHDSIAAPKIESAFSSINASSGQDVTSFASNSERGAYVGINASFENEPGSNNTLHVSNEMMGLETTFRTR